MATSDDDDRQLTGYLDGELDEAERAALDARLEGDPTLRARLDALRAAADRTRAAFVALLETAPLAVMRTRLDAALAASPRAAPAWSRRALAIAAAVVIVAFAAGAGVGRWIGAPEGETEHEDWRQAVAEYVAFYTSETFGSAPSPGLAEEIASLSRRLDTPLDVDRLQLDGLSLRRVVLFQYEGAPLGQIAYLDGATPVAFCILHDGEPDAAFATSSRGGFAVASWAHGGHGFMLIGKIPAERVTALARSLKEKTG